MAEATLARGLKDVVLDTTESSFIDGELGVLLYRGYNIHDLASKSNFEETSYLLLYGKLPTKAELEAFHKRLVEYRTLPQGVVDVIKLVQNAHPMDVLRTAVSALAAFDPDTEDLSKEANIRKSERMISQFPSIVAAHHRIRRGFEPVAPRSDLRPRRQLPLHARRRRALEGRRSGHRPRLPAARRARRQRLRLRGPRHRLARSATCTATSSPPSAPSRARCTAAPPRPCRK